MAMQNLHQMLQQFQYDWCSWIPNSPPTMRKPPPTKKGEVDVAYIVNSLPDRGRSCWHLGAVWALSQFQDNEVRSKKKTNNSNTLPLHVHYCNTVLLTLVGVCRSSCS